MQTEKRNKLHHFYVCDNRTCRLRYPAPDDDPRARRCPLCGSPTTRIRADKSRTRRQIPSARSKFFRVHLLLDNIRSAFNVGSIFRIADGVGVEHIHLCGVSPTPNNSKVTKTSLGAEESVAWSYCRNALDCIEALASSGNRIVSLESTLDSVSISEIPASLITSGLVLIAGNEVAGVDPGLLAVSDAVVHIPMSGVKRSLNVAVALGIAVYGLRDQASRR